MKRISALVLLVIMMVSHIAYAENVNAKIVDFDININGVYVDNLHSDYPLINFKGITYIPMTSDFCSSARVKSYMG